MNAPVPSTQSAASTFVNAQGSTRQRGATRWLTAAFLLGGAVSANVAFVGLGSTFDYPDVLQRPTTEILALFQRTRSTTMFWFAVLALGASLLAPAAVLLARSGVGRSAQWSGRVGVAAAVVQLVGLSRWFLLVPRFADRALAPGATQTAAADASSQFELAHTILGKVVGETLGYTFTALWTILVLRTFRQPPRWFQVLGYLSALAIALGILVPLNVPGADLANFVGYVLWSGWLVILAVRVVRTPEP